MNWNVSREVVGWAVQECEWQQSGEKSVLWMLDGLDWMYARPGPLTVEIVQKLGGIVEPRKNNGHSWRNCGVRVGMSIKPPQHEVPDLMERLISNVGLVDQGEDADEWFRQYEEIHPFRDGNGRTGNILWNWLRGTLDKPEMPPNFWDDPRRTPSSGTSEETET